MTTEVNTPFPDVPTVWKDASNKAHVSQKPPLDVCVQVIQWAADSAFENAMAELMRHFMTFGPEACPEWKEKVQQLVSQRLAVVEFVSQTVNPSASPQSTQS